MNGSTTRTTADRKRQYAAHRITKSVRKSETPGVQVLRLDEEGMTDIKQTAYRSSTSSRRNGRELKRPQQGALRQNSFTDRPKAAPTAADPSNNKSWLPQSSASDVLSEMKSLLRVSPMIRNRTRDFCGDVVMGARLLEDLQNLMADDRQWSFGRPTRFHRSVISSVMQILVTRMLRGVITNFDGDDDSWLNGVDLHLVCRLVYNHLGYYPHQLGVVEKNMSKLRYDIGISNNEALKEVLDQEKDIFEAYQSGKYESIASKHRDFVASCGKLLYEAQQRHELGDSSLLDLLLEHNVPEKWWKTGWQKFLDHLWTTGDVDAVESYIQEARAEVDRLRDETPVLRRHWDDCLEGLNRYSRRLHRRPEPGGPLSAREKEDEGGGHGLVNFASQWTVPLSAIGSTVLRGWHLIGTRVSHEVYKRVGYIFCTIDLKWVWSG